MNWLPIESALKDSNPILIFQESKLVPICVVIWDDIYDIWRQFGSCNPEEPTHWVPYWGDPK